MKLDRVLFIKNIILE